MALLGLQAARLSLSPHPTVKAEVLRHVKMLLSLVPHTAAWTVFGSSYSVKM